MGNPADRSETWSGRHIVPGETLWKHGNFLGGPGRPTGFLDTFWMTNPASCGVTTFTVTPESEPAP